MNFKSQLKKPGKEDREIVSQAMTKQQNYKKKRGKQNKIKNEPKNMNELFLGT